MRMTLVATAMMGFIGCSERPAQAPPKVEAPAQATPGGEAPRSEQPAAPPVAAPTPTPVAPPDPVPTPTPAPAEVSATPAEPDDKTLERTPGLTPVLPLVKVPAPPAVKGLAGTPGESPAMGPNDAIVKVFMFSDFQCPVCRRAVEPMKKLARAYPDDVQIIFKHHALSSHQRAGPSARATIAAMRQGRFWEMHDRLFDQQQLLDDATLSSTAQMVGCDLAQYEKDLVDPALAAQVAYESAQAQALDAPGTPAFFVNGEKTVGWGSYMGLESQVRRAVEDGKKLLADGVPRAEVAKKLTAAKSPEIAKILYGP